MVAHPLETLVQVPIPDLSLPSSQGGEFSFRQFVGRSPLVLFCYILNGSPGWVRELREFREIHPEFQSRGIALAGVSADSVESHRRWSERLRLPYPLLSDPERRAGRALGLVRRLGIGSWTVELFRRATLLVDDRGMVAGVWADVRIRGHGRQVLLAAEALRGA